MGFDESENKSQAQPTSPTSVASATETTPATAMPPPSKHHVRCWGFLVNMKRLSLFLLVLQNTANVLTIKHSRVGVRGPAYLPTTAVAVAEVVKIAVCVAVIFAQQGFHPGRLARVLWRYTVGNPRDALKVAVPAGLYAVQNNLLYVAVQNLSPGVFQVTYQPVTIRDSAEHTQREIAALPHSLDRGRSLLHCRRVLLLLFWRYWHTGSRS